jgi:flagella basal body P-ring formation protein FlgA
VTPARLERAVKQYLWARWGGRISRVNVRVTAPRETISLPPGRLSIRIMPLAKVIRPAPSRLRITLVVNKHVAQKLVAAVTIEAYAKVVLASRPIQRGEVVSVEHFTRGEWRIREIDHGLMIDPNEVIGRRTKVAISPGRPIPHIALERPDV